MRTILSILILFSATSCAQLKYAAVAPTGGTENLTLTTFGGSQSLESAGGTRYTSNHNKTAGQFFSTLAALATVGGNAYVSGAKEVTNRAVSANAAGVAKNASDNAAAAAAAEAAAKAATANAAIKAGAAVNPITVNPP